MKSKFFFAFAVFILSVCPCLTVSKVLYVDADAVNDPNQNGTFEFPFGTIQQAVAHSGDDDIILVHPGIYQGPVEIDLNDGRRSIRLLSSDPNDWVVTKNTKIEGSQSISIFSMIGDPNLSAQNFLCEIRGFTLTGGRAEQGAAIYGENVFLYVSQTQIVSNDANSIGGGICIKDGGGAIDNCILSGNRAESGSAIYCDNSSLNMNNCTLTGNRFLLTEGAGIYLNDCDSVFIQNNISWGNGEVDVDNMNSTVWLQYNNIEKIEGIWSGLGNISKEPCFVREGYWDDPNTPGDPNDDFWREGDCHLRSRGWRIDPNSRQWTWDNVTSPCLDSGNPGMALRDEPMTLTVDPQNVWGCNKRINMGAYGGTREAGIPPHDWALLSDLTNDGSVNVEDLSGFVAIWMDKGEKRYSDLNRDSHIDLYDMALFGRDWLDKTSWGN